MSYLYNTFLIAAKVIFKIAGIFNPKILSFLKVRENQILPHHLQGCIWMHCASLGEFEQGRPVIEAIRSHWPEKKIVLSFFSSSGYEARKNYEHVDWVGYLPLDTKSEAKRFIDNLNPSVVIFVKYEFWFNHLDQLIAKGIPFIFISSYWWKGHFLLRPWNYWLMKKVKKANAIFVQDQASKDLLVKSGYNHAIIAGDTRIDRVLTIKNQNHTLPYFQRQESTKPIFVAGSSWEEDEKVIKAWYDYDKTYGLIIVPHDVSASRISNVKELFSEFTPVLYSSWQGEDFKILIVDKMGLLSKIYAYAKVAYIGGGFGKGIHNTLEAAVYGIPVIVGPNHKSFREAVDLIDRSIGFSIRNFEDLGQIVNSLTPESLRSIQANVGIYFDQNKGATELIITYLKSL